MKQYELKLINIRSKYRYRQTYTWYMIQSADEPVPVAEDHENQLSEAAVRTAPSAERVRGAADAAGLPAALHHGLQEALEGRRRTPHLLQVNSQLIINGARNNVQ